MRLIPFRRRLARRGSALVGASWLSPRAKQAIAGIVLLVFSIIALLSFGGAAGPTGEILLASLRRLFGYLAYGVPFALIGLGLHLLLPQRVRLARLRVVGLSLTAVGLLGLLHMVGIAPDDALQAAADGAGGGYLGFLLSFPLSQAVSQIAAGLVFVGVLLIGLILAARLSPADLWERVGQWRQRRAAPEAEAEDAGSDELVAEEPVRAPLPRFRVNLVSGTAGASVAEEARPRREVVRRLKTVGRRYRPAILEVLQAASRVRAGDKETERRNKETIQRTLEHFGIRVDMGATNVGPTVTQYTLRPEQGTKLARITALQDDLALALAAHPIRIEAPIPNKDLVGIEIPNKAPSLVRLRDLLMSREWREADSPLTFPLGLDVSGQVVVDTLERLPHLLIAGATGAGKSVNIHTLIVSLLYRNSPEVLRLVLVDPKRVELPAYNDVPHLLAPVIVEAERTITALNWALTEMDVRYRLLEESGARNLLSFNLNNPQEAKPFIVIVIDELADLMVRFGREVEGPVVRLSQMARAVGIHLVLATQRPSVNVLTGLIKANVPSRIAFSVASQVDSRTILDMAGAEKLVGNGDMLYLSGDKARPRRIQGGFVSEEEVRRVAAAVRRTGGAQYDAAVTSSAAREGSTGVIDGAEDALLAEAKQVVVQSGKASASLLQRRLRVGYARAARLLDMLEERGVIGAGEGNKPRVVLVEDGVEEAGGAFSGMAAGEEQPDEEAGEAAADEAEADKFGTERRW